MGRVAWNKTDWLIAAYQSCYIERSEYHRRTSQGAGAAASPSRASPVFLGQKLIFFRAEAAAKNEKN